MCSMIGDIKIQTLKHRMIGLFVFLITLSICFINYSFDSSSLHASYSQSSSLESRSSSSSNNILPLPNTRYDSSFSSLENMIPVHSTDILNNELVQSKYKSIVIWSSDFHISPIADIKALLGIYGVKIIDKSLSGHCHLTNTCQHDLRVIHKDNGIELGSCPNRLRKEFYENYRNDKEFLLADAILCTHASSMCELFMPFNKTLIVIASTRYEIGRYQSAKRWLQWNENLIRIASKSNNVIGTNNRYDQEYLHYFTNLGKKIKLLPSYCGYIRERYHPMKPEILIAPARGVHPKLSSELFSDLYKYEKQKSLNLSYHSSIKNSFENNKIKRVLRLSHIRSLYPNRYEYSDLASHPAAILLPYQVSFMSLFEMYRMGIPLIVPSVKLLSQWHLSHGVISERTWDRVFGHPEMKSLISRHTHSNLTNSLGNNVGMIYDPNNEFNIDAIQEWVQLADFYVFPYILTFDSFFQLFEILENITDEKLNEISMNMIEYNKQEEIKIRQKWIEILENILYHKNIENQKKEKLLLSSSSSLITNRESQLPIDINEALMQFYGYRLSSECDGQINT